MKPDEENQKNSIGQNKALWTNEWEKSNPESEIQMWDYFGLRPWILKYTPRFGKVLEAGCGLGRYNFYLSNLGIDISGLDFSANTVTLLKSWQRKQGYTLDFVTGDVTKLPYDDNSLSGYLSFGVVEHFIEGPQLPIKEAFRVLRPGGIAIITTPAPSWAVLYKKSKRYSKNILKRIIGKKVPEPSFFQYEYSAKTLSNYIKKEGFYISRYSGADWLYTFTELGNYTSRYISKRSVGYFLSHIFENGLLSPLGAQSVAIAIKPERIMHCFFCGKHSAQWDSLDFFDVPVCESCVGTEPVKYYIKNRKVSFHGKYIIDPPVNEPEEKKCSFCYNNYHTDPLFEDFGFNSPVCKSCLSKKEVNLVLSNTSVQPVWRKRK